MKIPVFPEVSNPEQLLGKILHGSFNEIYLFHAETLRFVQVNFGARKNLGYSENQLSRMTPVDIKPEYDEQKFRTLLTPLLERKKNRLSFTTLHRRKNGSTYPVEIRLELSNLDGKPLFLAIVQDISERENHIKELEKLALHDSLTGLANRVLLLDRLQQSIALAEREHKTVTIIIVDPNRIREINDTLGHYNGDKLLIMIARRLQQIFRSADTVARLEGDQFAIVLLEDKANSEILADRLKKSFSSSFELQEAKLFIDLVAGFSIYPQHGDHALELLKNADIALQMSKQQKLPYKEFNTTDNPFTHRRLKLVSDLHTAIEHGEIILHYQPQIDLVNQRITGVEGLARWKHRAEGYIPPAEFIPLAEDTGLISAFTENILRLAAECSERWKRQGIQLPISINLSINNLLDKRFLVAAKELIESSELNPEDIVLELTESVLMNNPSITLNILNELHEMGFEIHIDDYGTGYSSLSYLTKLPADHLKIDQSFVRNMMNDEGAAVIVCSTIKLAHNLGIKVIAEGVEDQDTVDVLTTVGCDKAQGYFFSKPVTAEELALWIKHFHNNHRHEIADLC